MPFNEIQFFLACNIFPNTTTHFWDAYCFQKIKIFQLLIRAKFTIWIFDIWFHQVFYGLNFKRQSNPSAKNDVWSSLLAFLHLTLGARVTFPWGHFGELHISVIDAVCHSSGSHHSVTNYFLIYFVSRCRLCWVAARRIENVWAIAAPPSITQPLNIHQSTPCVATFFFSPHTFDCLVGTLW